MNSKKLANRNHSRGVTLVEMLISLVIASVVILGIAAVSVSVSNSTFNTSDQVDTDNDLETAVYQLSLAVRQAVNVKVVASNLDAYFTGSSTGAFKALSYNSFSTAAPGSVHTIAVFNREDANSGVQPGFVATSNFQPTAIYYQMPTADQSGSIYLDRGENKPALGPTTSNFLIDRVVNFEVLNVIAGPGNAVISVEFHIALRYFNGDISNQKGLWCPKADIGNAGCSSGAFVDKDQYFQVTLFDNSTASVGTKLVDQGAQGAIYYFKMLSPMGIL